MPRKSERVMASQQLLRDGGAWLGATREAVKWKCGHRGSTVTWGSGDSLGEVSIRTVEEIAAEAVAADRNEQQAMIDALADALERMMTVYEALMPGVRYIAVKNYAELNEAPIAARAALKKAGR